MKKIVGIIAAAALATSAFAEINIGSWGRTVVIPLNFVGEDAAGDKQVYSGAGANWDDAAGGKMGKDGVSFSAASENAGFSLDIAHSGTSLGTGDNANLWVKPFDMLKLTFGKVDYNNGRQNFCYGTYDHSWRLQGLSQGEGLAVWGRGVTGFVVNFNPIENLWFDYAANVKADVAYKSLWDGASFGVGYKIPDVADIRAVVIGRDGSTSDGYWTNEKGEKVGAHAIIQAAADITAIDNLFLTVGVSVPTTFGKAYAINAGGDVTWTIDQDSVTATTWAGKASDPTKASYSQEVIQAAVGARYTLDMLTFNAFLDTKIGVFSKYDNGEAKNDAFGYAAGFGVDVAFTDSLTLITDVRFSNDVYQGVADVDANFEAEYNRGKFGAYVGIEQKLSNAVFGAGVELGKNKTVIQALDNNLTVAIPLLIQVGF